MANLAAGRGTGAKHTFHHVGLLDLADSYCEAQLKQKCELIILQHVTVDNVAMLIAMATKYKTEVCSNYFSCECLLDTAV